MSPMLLGIVSPWLSAWMTPLWVLGIGALMGLMLCAAVWGLIALLGMAWPPAAKTAEEIPAIVREGVLWPLFLIVCGLSCMGVAGYFLAAKPGAVLHSLGRLTAAGDYPDAVTATAIPTPRDQLGEPDPSQETVVDLGLVRSELAGMTIRSNENVLVYGEAFVEEKSRREMRVLAGEPYQWKRTEQNLTLFPDEEIDRLYVVNRNSVNAEVTFSYRLQPAHPQVRLAPITAVLLLMVFLLYLAQAVFAPRASAVALATFKSETSQPLFLMLVLFGWVILLVFMFTPYNTFGEDIKMFKNTSMEVTMVLCIFQAIWAAGTSVTEEVEGRTALTVLSKPITRRSFLTGKYLGIAWTIALMFVAIGLFFLVLVAYKPIYDSREKSAERPGWEECHDEMASTAPGLSLAFMETTVLASVAVAISTRLGLMPNLVICFTIYMLGHLTPLLVGLTEQSGMFELVIFFAQLIATVIPNLDSFDVDAAVAANNEIPWAYLGMSLVYCLVFSLVSLMLALILFEDRDLA